MCLRRKQGQSHRAAHMAQRTAVTSGICFAVMLIVASVRSLIVLRHRRHLMVRLLIMRALLAKRHRGRSITLQRQPQHEADQEEFTR